MRTLAYCAQSLLGSTMRVMGWKEWEVNSCPPYSRKILPYGLTLRPSSIIGPLGFLYLALHGRPGDAALYGDNRISALTVDQVRGLDLSGCIVFAISCYLPETPFLQAFFDAGASAIIAGPGENQTGPSVLEGAALLGAWVRRGLGWGLPARRALVLAKLRMRMETGKHRDLMADALGFELYERERG